VRKLNSLYPNQMQKASATILFFAAVLLISCLPKKESSNLEQPESIEEAVYTSNRLDTLSRFGQAISGLSTRELPHIDKTNFDSFIDEDDLVNLDIQALKLAEVYPGIQTENSSFQCMYGYRLDLSPNFYTVVITVKIGDYQLETILINYDLKGKIIAHFPVAYEEIAEKMTQKGSRISDTKITTQLITWDLIKEIEEKNYLILRDGTLVEESSKKLSEVIEEYTLVLSVLQELNLDPLAVKSDLIRSKSSPNEINESILMIPEIVEEGEGYFTLNSHIVLTNPHTGEITHRFFEPAASNQWISDAIELQEISVDTDPYHVTDELRAFGTRVTYRGMSSVNPYTSEALSLYIKSGDRLQKILSNYPISTANGEWNGDCAGVFYDTKSIFLLSEQKTQGFYDLQVKSKVTETINEKDENGDCVEIEKISNQTSVLKYNGKEYLQSPVKQD